MSIVVCTFDRAAILDDALQSFAAVERPEDASFELLVIDNNSADATRSVAERWAREAPFVLRYAFEPKQGLSHARNLAVREAAGEWIWYVDDDVLFSPEWLVGAVAALHRFAGAAVVAGRVVPVFEPAAPPWLPASALPFYGLTSFGEEARWLGQREYPVGANAAFRRAMLARAGLFRPDLGRVGSSLLSGEEIDMVLRMTEFGDGVGYTPLATVQHRVPAERVTMKWLRRRAFWGGISQVLAVEMRSPRNWAGLLREAARTMWIATRGMLRGLNADNQIECAFRFGTAMQYVNELLRHRSQPRGG